MADATSFLLPTEPLEVLMRSLDSLDLTPPEERWTTSSEHARYLRTFFPPPPHRQDLPTEKCWRENDHYVKLSLLCRPISSPMLSRRAKRETPKFGSTHSRASIPRTKSALTVFLDLNPVSVQNIDDFSAPPVDDVLDLRHKLDAATSVRVRPFLQSISVPPTRKKSIDCSTDTPNVSEFLNHDSPPRCLPSLDSPPLFPRIVRGPFAHGGVGGDTKCGVSNPIHVSDLAPMLQVASPELIDGEDGDINDHNMEIVNGWTTLTFSSPPPPSIHSSHGSEVDELWNISPSGTPPTSLIAAKMDEFEIPRVRKFGHKNTLVDESTNDSGAAALLTVANSPGFFITSFISAPIPMTQTQKSITSQLEGIKFGMHPPHPLSPGQSTSNSLLGQPPSALEKQADERASASPADCVKGFDSEEQPFDGAVASIYVSTPQDPLSLLIEEQLDDKDIILMDVPHLPPPTIHPRNPTLFPKGMHCFVAPKGDITRLNTASHEIEPVGPTAFLRPVKGIKPLALDLSWRPFNFGKTIPTDEEVAGIANPVQLEVEALEYCDEYAKNPSLLDPDIPPILTEAVQLTLLPMLPRGCRELGASPTPKRAEESAHIEYLLTQRERMRASGAKLTFEAEVEVEGDADLDVDTDQRMTSWPHIDEHGGILFQHESLCHNEEHHGPRDTFDFMEYHSRSQTDYGYSFNDSGIDIMDNNFGQLSATEFGVSLLLHPFQDDLLHGVGTSVANKENVDDQSENKENVAPGDLDDYQPVDHLLDTLDTQYDWSGYFEFPESETPSFEPLSFASQSQLLGPSDNLTKSKVQDVPPLTPNAHIVKHPGDYLASRSEYEQTDSRLTKRRKLDDLVPTTSKDLFSTFIGFRNQLEATSSRTLEHYETRNDTPTPHQTLDVQILPRATPDDVFDQHTLRLPEPWIPSAAIHRYLASMTLIQKRALVRELQGHHCRVDLVERYDLGCADIIVDPDSGVLFIPLLALPAHLESTVGRISRESWRYLNLLVILEAFPSAESYRADLSRNNRPVPYAYTPPVCKAIKKLRRNLGIAEGCGTMDPRCRVIWAFANSIEEAAKSVRCFGDEACAISKQRGHEILWGEREWLEEDEREGESDLARVHGMNAFAAFIMLYDKSLETILELSPEARLADFGHLLGEERMTALNAVIESRMQQIVADVADVDP
ncbi:hypothetical protein L210DRAFT_962649 [Boletus edulis BED1]|uniref:Uncharacterized protein n=1 Tax=Boletus edulis BED1 TaxID=1328754 RepID=A0AAD4BKE8_BOLED|nr:hypothetical protein L210DRAFT_962649 [Boletus edulis BED1]